MVRNQGVVSSNNTKIIKLTGNQFNAIIDSGSDINVLTAHVANYVHGTQVEFFTENRKILMLFEALNLGKRCWPCRDRQV